MARPRETEDTPVEVPTTAKSLEYARDMLHGRLKRQIEDISHGHDPGHIALIIADIKALDSIKATIG